MLRKKAGWHGRRLRTSYARNGAWRRVFFGVELCHCIALHCIALYCNVLYYIENSNRYVLYTELFKKGALCLKTKTVFLIKKSWYNIRRPRTTYASGNKSVRLWHSIALHCTAVYCGIPGHCAKSIWQSIFSWDWTLPLFYPHAL